MSRGGMIDILFLTYSFIITGASILTIAFAIYAIRKRSVVSVVAFGLWMAGSAGWMISHQVLLLLTTPEQLLWSLRAELFFQVIVPPSFLLFALQFTGHHHWHRSLRQFLLFFISANTILWGLLNGFTELIWKNLAFDPANIFMPVHFSFGPMYSVFWVFAYISMIIAIWVFYRNNRLRGKIYQRQTQILIAASILPPLVNSFYLLFPQNPIGFNIMPIGVGISGVMIGFALFRYQLFDLPPVVYHNLIEKLQDGVMVVDSDNRLLYINQNAANVLNIDRFSIGFLLSRLLPDHSPWIKILNKDENDSVEIGIPNGIEQHYFEIDYSNFPVSASRSEKLIIIQDVTEERKIRLAEQTSREMAEVRAMELDVLRKIAEQLNQSVEMKDVTSVGLDAIVSWVGARFGYVVLSNGTGRPYIAGASHVPPLVETTFKRFPYCPSCRSFERFMKGEYQEPVAFMPCPILDEISISFPGLISIPLHLGERQLGALTLVMAPDAVFSGDEIRLLQTIGDQYSAAIERARLFENAEHLATVDSLTGLFNRRYFFQQAQTEFMRAYRYQHAVSVIMLDIDYFKRVNDTYGHMIGDQVLEQIAIRCRSILRVSDMIGRYGGEEFVILLPETDMDSAYTIANRIRLLIMDRPILTERAEISLTVSLGVACMAGDYDVRLEQVLDHADQALLKAKESGRNRICNWHDPFTKGGLFNQSL
ncbi:MAG: hypothetical protein CVU39_23745 [Chloroflexi bacterium HGW-Chloroflexi-10]|nr:MAG: hypothetical protein CVU39_23745 [Chloroflexi bacterium HGW-Chloroflexi-10]